MKKVLSLLLVVALLASALLVAVPASAEQASKHKGTMTVSAYRVADKSAATYTNPNVETETAGTFSLSYVLNFDGPATGTDQRTKVTITLKSGTTMNLVLQSRWYDPNVRTRADFSVSDTAHFKVCDASKVATVTASDGEMKSKDSWKNDCHSKSFTVSLSAEYKKSQEKTVFTYAVYDNNSEEETPLVELYAVYFDNDMGKFQDVVKSIAFICDGSGSNGVKENSYTFSNIVLGDADDNANETIDDKANWALTGGSSAFQTNEAGTLFVKEKAGWCELDTTVEANTDFTYTADIDILGEGKFENAFWMDIGSLGFFVRFQKNDNGLRFCTQVNNGDWSQEDILENIKNDTTVLRLSVARVGGTLTVTWKDSSNQVLAEQVVGADFKGGTYDFTGKVHRSKFEIEQDRGTTFAVSNFKLVYGETTVTSFKTKTTNNWTLGSSFNTIDVNNTKNQSAVWKGIIEEGEAFKISFKFDYYNAASTDKSAAPIVTFHTKTADVNVWNYARIQRIFVNGGFSMKLSAQTLGGNAWNPDKAEGWYPETPAIYVTISRDFNEDGTIANSVVWALVDAKGEEIFTAPTDGTNDVTGEISDFTFGAEGSCGLWGMNNLVLETKATKDDEWTKDDSFNDVALWNLGSEYSVHTWGGLVDVESPTCGDAGTRQRTCLDCGEVQTLDVPATGEHTYGDWVTVSNPGCLTKGSTERTCSVCEGVEKKSTPAKGHTPAADYTVDKEPTVEKKGSKSKHCTVCGEIIADTVEEIDKLTEQATTTEAPAQPAEKKGCGSTLGVSALALVLVSTLGMGLKRKH